MRNGSLMMAVALCCILFSQACSSQDHLPIHTIVLPPGFSIDIYSDDVPNARGMAISPKGTLFVGSRRAGKVYAVVDRDGDFQADQVYTIARGLNMPVGVAFHNGHLYISEVHRILRLDHIEEHLDIPPEPVVINDEFPDNSWHGWKFIRIGPDEKLYVPVGAPCNVCERDDFPFASIMRMELDGSNLEVFAKGIRNSVGFDWDPRTGELWFTDNGRDNLGDNLPPDELNHAPKAGMHFGFPYCHGGDLSDPEFGHKASCEEFVPPAQKLGPHVAALGMRFYDGKQFPTEYQNQIFIAEHGSWNRSQKIGYRLMIVENNGGKDLKYTPFATGWLQKERAWGRPVDVLVAQDGALLVSDDAAGVIYRIYYSKFE